MVYFHFYVLRIRQISLGHIKLFIPLVTTFILHYVFVWFLQVFWDNDAFDSQLEHFQIWYIRDRHLKYSVGSGILCTFLQRSVAKLKENWTTTNIRKKDQVAKEEKALHPFRKFFYEFCWKMYLIVTGSQWKSTCVIM